VHITTNVVSSNPGQARCTRYNIYYVIKFVGDLLQVSGFLRVLLNPTQIHQVLQVCMLQHLNWHSLEDRCKSARLVTIYKIANENMNEFHQKIED
jgi:hypothetical protein